MWQPFNPSTMWDRMLGGAETAMIMASLALAQEGHKVTVYAAGGKGTHDNVEWRDVNQRVTDCDALVCWENDKGTEKVEADHRIISGQCNDPSITAPYDRFIGVSNWHVGIVGQRYDIPEEKRVIIPNAIHKELYDKEPVKVPGRMIWSSSPDRGLHHLLRMFPKIKHKVPEAHLRIFYSFEPQFQAQKWGMNMFSHTHWMVKQGLNQAGVEHVGPVGKRQLAEEQLSSQLLLYPEETAMPTEGFGITYAEALAAQVAVVGSDVDAVGEVWGQYIALMPPPPFEDKDWVDIAVMLLKDENERKKYWERGREKVLESYTWEAVGKQWVDFMEGLNEHSAIRAENAA